MASIYEETRRFRRLLLARERRVLRQMIADWQAIIVDLGIRTGPVATLIEQLVSIVDRNGDAIFVPQVIRYDPVSGLILPPEWNEIPATWTFQQERFRQLVLQAETELERLDERYQRLLTAERRGAALDGATLAARQLSVSTAFATRLSVSAVEHIAAAITSPQLTAIFTREQFGAELARAMLTGIARGANPRQVAAEVTRGLEKRVRNKALTIARTEMARAQRYGQMDAFKSAGVQQWQWQCARDANTCPACWAMDGETFDVEGAIEDHPNGRCSLLPVATGIDLSEVPSKDAAWNALSASEQRQVLGPTRYDLLQKNELSLSLASADTPNGIGTLGYSTDWGTSIRVAPLRA